MQPTQSHLRVDELLKAAERGSIPHLKRLEHEWPTDPSLSQRALMILLEHFKAQAPHLRRLQLREVERASEIMLAASVGLEGAFKSLATSTQAEANKFTAAFHPYLQEYFAFLRFLILNAQGGLSDKPKMTGSFAAGRVVILFRTGLCNTDDPEILECILDIALFLFMDTIPWKWQKEAPFTQAQYEDFVAPLFRPFEFCLGSPSMREALFKKLNSATTENLKRLCDTFSRQCSECSACFAKDTPGLDCKTFSSYVNSAFTLCSHVPRFFTVVLKSRFPALALKAALSVPLAPASNLPGRSLALETASAMFNQEILRVDNSRRLIVQLLEAGIIETLTNDILSWQGEDKEGKVFQEWRTSQLGTANPLQTLMYASYDLRVANALYNAVMAIPESTREDLIKNSLGRDVWVHFLSNFLFHEEALRRLPNDHIPLCDSLMVIPNPFLGYARPNPSLL